jgi:hypothetical protein
VLFEKMSQCQKQLRRVPNVPRIERFVNILNDHHPDALRATGLFEQIVG